MIAAGAIALYEWLVLATTLQYPGAIGIDYNTLGTDWMVFYGAIRSVLDGHAPLILDGERFTNLINTMFSHWLTRPLEYRPWTYPPGLLLLIWPFAPLGFIGSYLAFQFVTAGMLAAALHSRKGWNGPQPALLCMTLLCPAATVNVIDGQCAFLVAALMIGGFRLIESRPLLGGLVLGILTFKPQFFVLVPLALMAAGQWRALAAAAVSAAVMLVASGLAFGWDLWLDWFPLIIDNLVSPNPKWVEYGRMWGHSVYTCAFLLGAPLWLASWIQLAAMLGGALATLAAFRSQLGIQERIAVLLAATVLAAPHSGTYDALLLVIAAAFWLIARGGVQPLWCWTVAFMVWLLPAVSPPLLAAPGRLAPLLTVLLIVLVLRADPRISRFRWLGMQTHPS